MKIGFDEQGKFYVEYKPCARPVKDMRTELELACQRIVNEGKVMISLSSGLDSQVLVHSFAKQGLPYECAFLHLPGFNDSELRNIYTLEKKYGFKTRIVVIDAMAVKEEMEYLADQSGVPPQHHLTKRFFDQLPETYNIVEGIENPDLYVENGRWKMVESYYAIDTVASWFHKDRKNKVIHLDRRSEYYEFALSMMLDDVAKAYRVAYPFIKNHGLVDPDTNKGPPMYIWGWTLFIKPIQYGMYWKDELIYFPKFAVQQQVDYLAHPKVNHDYMKCAVSIDFDRLINHLTNWGSDEVLRFTQSYRNKE